MLYSGRNSQDDRNQPERWPVRDTTSSMSVHTMVRGILAGTAETGTEFISMTGALLMKMAHVRMFSVLVR
jgi:hypothetical protein